MVNNDRKSLRLLLEAGADVHEYGPVVDDFFVYSEDESLEDESSVDSLGRSNYFDHTQILSPIQWASYMGSVEVARDLCDAGADVNQESNPDCGNMALHLAANRGNHAMVKFLVSRGASVNAFSNGNTALSSAVTKGNLKIIGYLLRHGADPNLRDLSASRGNETLDASGDGMQAREHCCGQDSPPYGRRPQRGKSTTIHVH